MSDLHALQQRHEQRFFAQWDNFVPAEMVAKSEEAIRNLIERLIALGSNPTREQVQAEIDKCVRDCNDLDRSQADSWICTIEREDISEVLSQLIDLCGFEGSEEWLCERDW